MEDIEESLIIYKLESKKGKYLVAINASVDEKLIDRKKLDEFVQVNKISKIFSKRGISKIDIKVEEGLILENKSVNVFKLGEVNGL